MYYLIILFFLAGILYISLRKALLRSLAKTVDIYQNVKSSREKLVEENNRLVDDCSHLEKISENTTALYDVASNICKFLDMNAVFTCFKEELSKYVRTADCRLLSNDAELVKYPDYRVTPLVMEQESVFYLLVKDLSEQDSYKYNILSQQLYLCLKRAFLYRKIEELAITDSLTQTFSRRYFLERFEEEIIRAKRFKYSLAFLMVDIDHFKGCNDRFGHLVGDVILNEISTVIKGSIRQIDFIGRYGGEEFAILLAETDKEQARFAAERIRQAVEYKHIQAYDEDLKVTISIGISVFPDDAQDSAGLIEKADRALYRAKQGGRNRVYLYSIVK